MFEICMICYVHELNGLDGIYKKSRKRYMVSGTWCSYVGVCEDETMKGAAALEGPMTYDST